MKDLPKLQTLDLCFNMFGYDGAKALAGNLQDAPPLQTLGLSQWIIDGAIGTTSSCLRRLSDVFGRITVVEIKEVPPLQTPLEMIDTIFSEGRFAPPRMISVD